jgi:hypothetical protein
MFERPSALLKKVVNLSFPRLAAPYPCLAWIAEICLNTSFLEGQLCSQTASLVLNVW